MAQLVDRYQARTGQIALAYGGRLDLYKSGDLRGLGVRIELRGLV